MAHSNRETQVLDEVFRKELIEKLDELRKSNLLCDTTLRADGQEFAAHRSVLSVGSQYFRTLFAMQLNVQETEKKFVDLKEVTCQALTEVLQYVYTGKAKLNSSNAEEIVVASDYLMVEGLKSKASLFLEESLSNANCLALESFASQYNCESLKQAAATFIRKNFVTVAKSSDFLSLNEEKLLELLSDDEIIVPREEEVYHAAVRWVKYDLASRENYFPELLKCLRLFSMSKFSLRQILCEEELVKNNVACMTLLLNGLDYFLFPDRYQNVSLIPRLSLREYEDVVVLIGGKNIKNEELRSLRCFVLSSKNWISLPDMPQSCSNHCAGVCGGILFVIHSIFSSRTRVYSLNPKCCTSWNSTEFEIRVGRDCSVTAYNEQLYIVGGSSDDSKGVKVFNPALGTWKRMAPMNIGRAGHCAVLLQKHIYAIGGHNNESCQKSVERYNPVTNRWQTIRNISNARTFAAAAVSNGKIIVVGGFSAMKPSKVMEVSCEMFDPCTNEWSLVSSPAISRAACGIVSIDDIIYLFGGQHEECCMETVESFDLKQNEWRAVAFMPTEHQRSFHQALVLRLPKDIVSLQEKIARIP